MIRKDLTILLDLYDKIYHINLEYYSDYLIKKKEKRINLNNFKKNNKNNIPLFKCYQFFKKLEIYESELINLVQYYVALNIERHIIDLLYFLKLENIYHEKNFSYKTTINLYSYIKSNYISKNLYNNIKIFNKISDKVFNKVSFLKYSLQQTYNLVENNKVKIYNLNTLLNSKDSENKITSLILENLEKKNKVLKSEMKLLEEKINLIL